MNWFSGLLYINSRQYQEFLKTKILRSNIYDFPSPPPNSPDSPIGSNIKVELRKSYFLTYKNFWASASSTIEANMKDGLSPQKYE